MSDTIIAEMQQQFALMQQITRHETSVSWTTRKRRLQQLEKMLEDNREAIITAIQQDFGQRPPAETTMLELFPSLTGIRHLLKRGKKWMATQRVGTGLWFLPAKSYVQPQPKGVVGIIAPWNYPLYMIIEPLAGALVAGNRAMLKVSEAVPHFEAWLVATVPKYFSRDEVYVVAGGIEVAKAFSELAFDHLFFTGSTTVGKQVMQAAAKNLTPVTLELGGKSPVILTPSTDISYAVNHIWLGKSINAGQTCIAPDYVLLPATLQDSFVEQSKQWFLEHYPDLPHNPDTSYIINPRQAERLKSYLMDAEHHTARLHPLTPYPIDTATGLFPPTIVTDSPPHAKVITEEIFGPILPIIIYDTLDRAIAYVNDRPRPLALYVFGTQKAQTQQVLAQTISGGACVNETIFHIAQPNLPFGGVGSSGMGNYHGKYSFDTFSHHKSVFKQSPLNTAKWLMPPYGQWFWLLMKIIAK